MCREMASSDPGSDVDVDGTDDVDVASESQSEGMIVCLSLSTEHAQDVGESAPCASSESPGSCLHKTETRSCFLQRGPKALMEMLLFVSYFISRSDAHSSVSSFKFQPPGVFVCIILQYHCIAVSLVRIPENFILSLLRIFLVLELYTQAFSFWFAGNCISSL